MQYKVPKIPTLGERLTLYSVAISMAYSDANSSGVFLESVYEKALSEHINTLVSEAYASNVETVTQGGRPESMADIVSHAKKSGESISFTDHPGVAESLVAYTTLPMLNKWGQRFGYSFIFAEYESAALILNGRVIEGRLEPSAKVFVLGIWFGKEKAIQVSKTEIFDNTGQRLEIDAPTKKNQDANLLILNEFDSAIQLESEASSADAVGKFEPETGSEIVSSQSQIHKTIYDPESIEFRSANVPGKRPQTTIGRLAIIIAYEIECKVERRASRNEVMVILQKKVREHSEPDVLMSSLGKDGVKWITNKGVEKTYSFEACGKTLSAWNISRTSSK